MLLAGEEDVVWRINMHMVDRNSVMSLKIDTCGVSELDIIVGLELGWSLPISTRFEKFIVIHYAVLLVGSMEVELS